MICSRSYDKFLILESSHYFLWAILSLFSRSQTFIPINLINFQGDNWVIKSVLTLELLGIQIDERFNFNLYLSKICKSKSKFLNFRAKEVLIKSYIISNSNYCILVWMFWSAQLVNKIENLQRRALRFLYDNFEARFWRLQRFAIKKKEVYKEF